jgi:acylphosphatase
MERLHAIVSGRVQGVFYRAWTQDTCAEMGLTGWVKNRSDGGVEILAEGARPKLDQLVRLCHQGPAAAQVTDVETEFSPAKGDLVNFQIRYD